MEEQNEVKNHVLPGQARLLHKPVSGHSVGGPGLGGPECRESYPHCLPTAADSLAVVQAPGEPRDREKTQTWDRHLEGQTRGPHQGQLRTKLLSNESSVLGTGGVLPLHILTEQ